MSDTKSHNRRGRLFRLTLFAMLGALMFVSKLALAFLPNIHLLGMFIMAFTLVFREKALIPIYIYVMLEGVYQGFSVWWVPYLYIWAVLWGVTMLLPRDMPEKIAYIVYPVVCGLFGLAFGTLFAPVFALLMGMNLQGMFAWIVAGLPFDAIHAAGNFVSGLLVLPIARVLGRAV